MLRFSSGQYCTNYGNGGASRPIPKALLGQAEHGFKEYKLRAVSPAMLVKDTFWRLWNPTKRVYSFKRSVKGRFQDQHADVIVYPDEDALKDLNEGKTDVFEITGDRFPVEYKHFLSSVNPDYLAICIDAEHGIENIKKKILEAEPRATWENLGSLQYDHHYFTFNMDFLLAVTHLGFDVTSVLEIGGPAVFSKMLADYNGTYHRELKCPMSLKGPEAVELVRSATGLYAEDKCGEIQVEYGVASLKPRPRPFGIQPKKAWAFGLKDIFGHFIKCFQRESDYFNSPVRPTISMQIDELLEKSLEFSKSFCNDPTKIEKIENPGAKRTCLHPDQLPVKNCNSTCCP